MSCDTAVLAFVTFSVACSFKRGYAHALFCRQSLNGATIAGNIAGFCTAEKAETILAIAIKAWFGA